MEKQIELASGFAPIGMSLVALALVFGHVAAFGVHPPPRDESWEAQGTRGA